MRQAVIAGYGRTAFQPAASGAFAGVRPDQLAATAIAAVVARAGVDPESLDEVLLGCGAPEAEQGGNLARIAALLARLPVEIAAMTISRNGASSASAVHLAAGLIAAGAGEAYLCAGVESRSRTPYAGFNPSPNPRVLEAYLHPAATGEATARRLGIGRAELDAATLDSHRRAAAGQAAGRLAAEIVPAPGPTGPVLDDGGIRAGLTLAELAAHPPDPDGEGLITAAHTAPAADGAAALLVVSEDYARRWNLQPLARIAGFAAAASAPERIDAGALAAAERALAEAGWTASALDAAELDEACIVLALACRRALRLEPDRTNPDGGSQALGHPTGAAGARLIGRAALDIARFGARRTLALSCAAGGQGVATALEAP